MNIKSLPYFSVEQALNKLGRSLYPFSWPSNIELFYKKKIKGDLFNTPVEVEIVENIRTEEIKKNLEKIRDLRREIDGYDSKGNPVFIDLREGLLTITFECSRLAPALSSGFPFIERVFLDAKFETGNHAQMVYLKHLFIVSHIKNLLFEAACEQSVRLYETDADSRDSCCFDEKVDDPQGIFDNWNRILLNGRYLAYTDEDVDISFWESPVEVHPIDLQSFINALLTTKTKTWDLGIEEAFSFLSPTPEESSSYDIIIPFLQNIDKTPKLEKMPLDQALRQLFQHYAGYMLELTQAECLYAKIKTEFHPGKILPLTKPQLVEDVNKFLENMGFTIKSQQDVNKAIKEDPSLEGKIILKSDAEAIATLLFNTDRKMGGPRPRKKSKDTPVNKEQFTS